MPTNPIYYWQKTIKKLRTAQMCKKEAISISNIDMSQQHITVY